jgi:hypothetical protein
MLPAGGGTAPSPAGLCFSRRHRVRLAAGSRASRSSISGRILTRRYAIPNRQWRSSARDGRARDCRTVACGRDCKQWVKAHESPGDALPPRGRRSPRSGRPSRPGLLCLCFRHPIANSMSRNRRAGLTCNANAEMLPASCAYTGRNGFSAGSDNRTPVPRSRVFSEQKQESARSSPGREACDTPLSWAKHTLVSKKIGKKPVDKSFRRGKISASS